MFYFELLQFTLPRLTACLYMRLGMNTKYALHATYGKPIIPVSEICEEFFACRIKTANERIRAYTFPIPAFRLSGKNNGDYFVNIDDLAAYIDEHHAKAKAEWQAVNQHH